MKAQTLKKQLIKVSILALIATSASAAAAYGIYAWSSGLQEEARVAKNNLSRALGDVTSRQLKNEKAQEYLELYLKITGESEQAKISDLNRDKAQAWLKQAALQNNITNLEGAVDPIKPIASESFKKKTFEGITSKVTLKFGAMTDEQIYRFVEAILTRFPGYVKITRFELIKEGEITDDVLIAASRGTFPDLVTGIVEFNWIGIREITDEDIQKVENVEPAIHNRRKG